MTRQSDDWWQKAELLDRHAHGRLLAANVLDYTAGADFWPKANLRAVDEGNWIAKNWCGEWEQMQGSKARRRLCQLALQADGPILELAAGAGGGNLSPLLHLRPEAQLIVNDLESRLLTRWASFLARQRLGKNVLFVACDACNLPLVDKTIGCISAVGGLSSLLGSSQDALRECARVLKPQGSLLISELVLSKDSLSHLPPELCHHWAGLSWLLGQGEQLLAEAGFSVQTCSVEVGRRLDKEADGLAEEARRFDRELTVENHYLVAWPNH